MDVEVDLEKEEVAVDQVEVILMVKTQEDRAVASREVIQRDRRILRNLEEDHEEDPGEVGDEVDIPEILETIHRSSQTIEEVLRLPRYHQLHRLAYKSFLPFLHDSTLQLPIISPRYLERLRREGVEEAEIMDIHRRSVNPGSRRKGKKAR